MLIRYCYNNLCMNVLFTLAQNLTESSRSQAFPRRGFLLQLVFSGMTYLYMTHSAMSRKHIKHSWREDISSSDTDINPPGT